MTVINLGSALRLLRTLNGWSQHQAAKAAEQAGYPRRMDGDTWSKLECGRRFPSFNEGLKLLSIFGVEVRFALDGEDITPVLDLDSEDSTSGLEGLGD
jgi:transcriptional regulator with XRE-family HTH domain